MFLCLMRSLALTIVITELTSELYNNLEAGTWLLKVNPKVAEIEGAISGHFSSPTCAAKYFSHCFDRE